MNDNNVPSYNHNLEQREGFAQFLDYLFLYEQYVLNPNTNITILLAMENNIRKYCAEFGLDFTKLINSIMKDKPLDFTKYIDNWLLDK